MSKIKQDFVGGPNKGRHVINIFESPKANAIYEGPISWTIDNNIVHINWVEIPNSLYVPNGCEQLISTQHFSQKATSAYAYSTSLDGTWCVTHHDCAALIWVGGRFFCSMPLDKHKVFTIYNRGSTIVFWKIPNGLNWEFNVYDVFIID